MLTGLGVVIFSLFLILVGIILLIIALALFLPNYKLLKKGACAIGTVVRYEGVTNEDDQIAYFPVIKFWTKSEIVVEFKHNSPKGFFSNYRLNQEVMVIYDPEKPHLAKIKTNLNLWSMPLFMALLSLPCFLVAFAALTGNLIVWVE